MTRLLVAWYAHIYQEFCWWVYYLTDPPDAYQGFNDQSSLCPDLLWFYHQFASLHSTNVPEAEEWIQNLQKAHDEAIATYKLAIQNMME